MLPRGGQRAAGCWASLLALVSLGLVRLAACRRSATGASDSRLLGCWPRVTVISAAAAVTFRSPVYCAIWFALSLLGTAGLFLFQGAQFLGVATIVVYAGAILVTFLFVLMLAQPQGHAYYDRVSWEALLSAVTGAVLVGILTMAWSSVLRNPRQRAEAATADRSDASPSRPRATRRSCRRSHGPSRRASCSAAI